MRARTWALPDASDLLALPWTLAWMQGGQGLVAWGEAARWPLGTGRNRLAHAGAALGTWLDALPIDDPLALPGTGPVAFASVPFDPREAGGAVVVPEVIAGRRGEVGWVTVIGNPGQQPPVLTPAPPPRSHGRVRYAGSSLSELGWMTAVDRAVADIKDGALEKVVLARDRRVWARAPLDPRLLAARLAGRFPGCFTFCIDGLIGASPELLVRRLGREVESVPLAGSAARGGDPASDARLGDALLASGKDRAEHEHAVASVRAVLAEHCDALTVDAQPWLLRLANVQHLATRVRGRLRDGATAMALAGALHPTAAVCGTPTEVALERIRALERMTRGRYSGPVGWVDARGDGEWAIALRCAELAGTQARLFAGAGIVDGSLPEAELEETRLKLRAMQSALETP